MWGSTMRSRMSATRSTISSEPRGNLTSRTRIAGAGAWANSCFLDPAAFGRSLPSRFEQMMDDDCWLPGFVRATPELTRAATLRADSGDVEALRSGMDRPDATTTNRWDAPLGTAAEYVFGGEGEGSE